MTVCIKNIVSLCNIDIMARLILLLCILHIWRHSKCELGQLPSKNDYLFTVGDDENGYGKLLVASRLTNTLTISLGDGYSVSLACGPHPSRCRELSVETIETGIFTRRNIILIPLEKGVQILELAYNGTSNNQLNFFTRHTLLFDSVNGNHSCGSSLGIHKIGSDYFIPCFGTDSLYYVCELMLNSTAIAQSTLQPCHQVNVSNDGTGVHPSNNISNIVAMNESLIFLIQNILYEVYPRLNSNSPLTYVLPTYCSSVSQLLISPLAQDESELLVYCQNNNVITYDLNHHQITRIEEASNVPYPCSPTAEYIVHLSQDKMEFSYKLNSDGNTVIRIFESLSSSTNFHSGACLESEGSHLFAYVDASVGVYLFNATSESLWLLPNTQGCIESECELPLVFDNRYIVIRNKLEKNVTVFDALFNCSIIYIGAIPLQLVTLISDLPAIANKDVLLSTTTNSMQTTDSSSAPDQSHSGIKRGVHLEVIVPVVIISMIIVITLIAIIVILVIFIKKRCSGNIKSGRYELDIKFAKQTQEVVIENHLILESTPIKIATAKQEIEADNDSSFSNPVYSGESHDDMESDHEQEKTPASVTVLKNKAASDCSSDDAESPYRQNSDQEEITDLRSEAQNLIEPVLTNEVHESNATASLEDNANPLSNNQGEVIINIHALNNSLEVDSQLESQPVLSTDRHTEIVIPPTSLDTHFDTEKEEQTMGIANELSTSADYEDRDSINDTKDSESEGDRSDKFTLVDEEPPVVLNGKEEQASSELLLSVGHKDTGHISDIDDREKIKSNNEREKSYYDDGMANQSPGLPIASEIDSRVLELEPDDLTETTKNQYQIPPQLDQTNKERIPIDSVLSENLPESIIAPIEFVPSLKDSKDKEEIQYHVNMVSVNLPKGEIIVTNTNQSQGCACKTTLEYMDCNPSQPNVQEEGTECTKIDELPEGNIINKSGESYSKDDLEAPAEELGCEVKDVQNSSHTEAIAGEGEHILAHLKSEETDSSANSTSVRPDINDVVSSNSSASTDESLSLSSQEDSCKEADIDSNPSQPNVQEERSDCTKIDEPPEGNIINKSGENYSKDDLETPAEELGCEVKDVLNSSHAEAITDEGEHILAHIKLKETDSSANSTSVRPDIDDTVSSNSSDESLSVSSQEDSCKETDEAHDDMEADRPGVISEDTLSINQGEEHNDIEAQTVIQSSASNVSPLETQEEIVLASSSKENYEEIAPIKCTFVGRTIKTVARTLTDSSADQIVMETTTVQNKNHISSLNESELHSPLRLPDTECSESEKKNCSKENFDMTTGRVVENGEDSPLSSTEVLAAPIEGSKCGRGNEMLMEGLLQSQSPGLKNLSHLEGINTMEITNQKSEKESSGKQTTEQMFPYKFETVV